MHQELINLIPQIGSSSVPLPTQVGHLTVEVDRLDDHTNQYHVLSGSEVVYRCSTLRSLRSYLTMSLSAAEIEPHTREARYGINRLSRRVMTYGSLADQLRQVADHISESTDVQIMGNSRQPFSLYLRRV